MRFSVIIRALFLLALTVTYFRAVGAEPAKEHAEFCAKIEATLHEGEPSFLNKSLDMDGILARVMRGFTGAADLKETFGVALRRSFQFGEKICDTTGQTGSYRLLRIREFQGRPSALFRLVGDDSGVVYHDLALTTDASGAVKIADVYVHNSGEWISETFRRGFLPMADSAQNDFLEKTEGTEKAFLQSLSEVQGIMLLVKAGRASDALKMWAALPEPLRKDKNLLLMRLSLAAEVGGRELHAAIEDFTKMFPDEPALDLALLDVWTEQKKFDEAMTVIERIEKSLGGDPYLHVLRAGVLLKQDKFADAKRWAQKTVAEEPTLVDGPITLLTISLLEKDHAETARLLTVLETQFKLTMGDLTKAEQYEKFVKSKEYAAWLESRKRE
jgi:tetratricopeptide (TPR) repeat protein